MNWPKNVYPAPRAVGVLNAVVSFIDGASSRAKRMSGGEKGFRRNILVKPGLSAGAAAATATPGTAAATKAAAQSAITCRLIVLRLRLIVLRLLCPRSRPLALARPSLLLDQSENAAESVERSCFTSREASRSDVVPARPTSRTKVLVETQRDRQRRRRGARVDALDPGPEQARRGRCSGCRGGRQTAPRAARRSRPRARARSGGGHPGNLRRGRADRKGSTQSPYSRVAAARRAARAPSAAARARGTPAPR